ncbi:MAG: hypothetical protein KAR14_15275 [Candidatus Aminicenantes bacterium]|nr:hypothetical protein [Candidatus Aminicenantes bacterium]
MKFIKIIFFISVIQFSFILQAHHAMEYIEMESYSTARKGEFIFHLHFDYMVDDNTNPALDHWEFTPGISFGISDRLMFDFHTHYAKFGADHVSGEPNNAFSSNGPSPFMEAMALSLQYRITQGLPVNFAVSVTYEVPFARSRDLLGGEDVIEGMLIAAYEFGNHSNLTINFLAGYEGGESFSGWALGVKTSLTGDPHGIAAGLEMLGDFSGETSIIAGIYFPLGSENIIFKTGLEFSSGSSRANSTMMYRF